MKKILLPLLLSLLYTVPAWAQKIDVEKKTGLISVDGRPSFYLVPINRVLFTADYALQNLQHEELAYLKAEQLPTYSPALGNSTELYYSFTFSRSGNYCELHGFNSFSVTKSLARNIAAANLIQGNQITEAAERKFIVIHNGVFLNAPNEPDYAGAGNDNNRDDNRNDDPVQMRDQRDDRNNDRNNDRPDNRDDHPQPMNINIHNGHIYDGDELIGNYTQPADKSGKMIVRITGVDRQLIATASRGLKATDDWKLVMADGTKLTIRYYKESPLVKLFAYLADKRYL